VTINRSVASGNSGDGFKASSDVSGATAELSCEECVASNNIDGFLVSTSSGGVATIRVSHSTATNNAFGFVQSGTGLFQSLGNNTVRGNSSTDTSGTITPITLQ
jgi:hypothetical protein